MMDVIHIKATLSRLLQHGVLTPYELSLIQADLGDDYLRWATGDVRSFSLDSADDVLAFFGVQAMQFGLKGLEGYARRMALMSADWQFSFLLRASDDAQDRFDKVVASLAGGLFRGRIDVDQWHRGLAAAIVLLALIQATLGAGQFPNTAVRDYMVSPVVQKDLGYLQRFADHVSAAAMLRAIGVDKPQAGVRLPMTEGQTRARSQNYGGSSRALFYRVLEERTKNEGASVFAEGEGDDRDSLIGWIMQYISKDDGGTCPPCLAAEGFYLPGDGPFPGEVCDGRAKCRCRRKPVYDYARWREMSFGV